MHRARATPLFPAANRRLELGEDQGQTLTANWISGKVGPGREKRFGVDAPDFAGSWTIRIADSLIIVLSAPYRFV
jgi:hypothetical protein